MRNCSPLAILFCCLLLTCVSSHRSMSAELLAGPMLGYVEHREAMLWLQTRETNELTVDYRPVAEAGEYTRLLMPLEPDELGSEIISKIALTDLEPDTTYEYKIALNGEYIDLPYETLLTTKPLFRHSASPESFSFLFGSCAYTPDSSYDEPGKRVSLGTEIYRTMATEQADFMIWGGDNLYLRPVDYSSASGIAYRYAKKRQEPFLQKLLAQFPHYAIWDDHDYGPNNSNKSFELKDVSGSLFVDYWANKTFGENGDGVYGKFQYGDAEFFLLDDRWFRDETELSEAYNTNKTQLGSQQLDWLKNSLAGSRAAVKFIVVGGQFLNEHTNKESFNHYRHERRQILDFIEANRIEGVIFLSGDRHHTEILKYDRPQDDLYPLYELTCSPLSSIPHRGILDTPERYNPMRLHDTLVLDGNYCRITVKGEEDDRRIRITSLNEKGRPFWTREIFLNELKYTYSGSLGM